jgi:hypothetical protein
MKDYLGRAAERATQARPEVRPAVPSFFDSEKNLPTLVLDAETPNENFESENRRKRDPQATRDEVAPVEERIAAVQALRTKASDSAPEPNTEIVTAQNVRSLDATVVTPESLRPEAKEIRSAEISLRNPKGPLASAEQIETVPDQAPAPVQGSSAVPRIGTLPAESRLAKTSLSADPSMEQPSAPAENEAAAQTTAPSTAIRALVSAPRKNATKGRAPIQTKSFPGNDSGSARTIRVTIGRIEVRAIQPPPERAPPRPVRAAPKMSLDEYLRSRNGGGG